MNYKKHYDSLIERAKNRYLTGYAENHHIIPKCLGGSNAKSNLVKLTGEEHYVAHLLLVKMYPNEHGLLYAALRMTGYNEFQKRNNNKLYAWVRKKLSMSLKGRIAPNIGIPHTEEARKKMKLKRANQRFTDETRKKMSFSKLGKPPNNKGKLMKPQIKVICPHCNKVGAFNAMQRWHFDRCKKAPISYKYQ